MPLLSLSPGHRPRRAADASPANTATGTAEASRTAALLGRFSPFILHSEETESASQATQSRTSRDGKHVIVAPLSSVPVI